MPVTIGALRETAPNETRVSLIPEVADKLVGSDYSEATLDKSIEESRNKLVTTLLFPSVKKGRERAHER
jgi:hypothetical protein